MASSVISHPVRNSQRSRVSQRHKNKIIQIQNRDGRQPNQAATPHDLSRWRTQAEQRNYSTKLLQALRRVTPNPSSSGEDAQPPHRSGRAVRETADRVLAVAAKGRTRWSRAILKNRLKLNFIKHKRKKAPAPRNPPPLPPKKKQSASILRLKGKNLPEVQRKASTLGRLVPGCREEPLPVILEEVIDYIPALEMQIRAMTLLTDLLSGSGSGSGSGASTSMASTSEHPPT